VPRPRDGRSLRHRLLAYLPVATGVLAAAAVYLLSRDVAFQRFFEDDTASVRSTMLPVYLRMAGDFFPFGTGFGSFDSMFRFYEPAAHLGPAYLNHAHNDLAEIVIEGGLLPLLLLVPFLAWIMVRGARLWFGRLESNEQLLGRIGSAAALLVLLSSLVDYPLRTPLISVLMTIACYWIHEASRVAKESRARKSSAWQETQPPLTRGESGEGMI
jgi:O-antigen ligase